MPFGLLKPSYVRWLAITVIFLLISWLHMGSSLTQCNSVVLSTPGDHTAGIMYSTWVHPSSPFPGFSRFTNYPFGEDLHQPLAISSFTPSSAHIVLTRLTNLVCGWNLLVLIGYMSSALMMFGFMQWLTKDNWVAFFAAYAVTYTPYHAFASHGQIAGLLNGLFILAFWQFLNLWRRPNWFKAVCLGGTLGVGFYTDGYFILIGGVMLLSLWLASLSYGLFANRGGLLKLLPQLKSLFLASLTALLCLLPLVWVNLHYAAEITSTFGAARGNIQYDAQTYSAKLNMYLTPKSLLFLGFSVVALALVGIWFLWQDYQKYRKQPRKKLVEGPQLFDGWAALILALMAIWFSLQPLVHVWGITLHNPSGLIIAVTASWRVFGRLYATASLGVITLAGIGLLNLVRRLPKYRYAIIGVSLLLMVVELKSFPATSLTTVFNYKKDTPQVYSWLRNNPQIQGIVEYPLDEPPQGNFLSDYYTFQEVSNKPMLNSLLPNSTNAALRRSIAGINDPQTLPVLRALRVGLVNLRPVNAVSGLPDLRASAANNAGLQKIFTDRPMKIDSFLIKPGMVAEYALTIPTIQYFQIAHTKDGGIDYMVDDDTVLSLFKLPGATSQKTQVTISFTISADSNRQATIIQNGVAVWHGTLTDQSQTIQVSVSPDYPLSINTQRSTQLTHVTLSKLQVN